MSASRIRNEMILASAGSGKTYQLTNRYIQLMALGAAPERIIALTFTRKAAGEFFDEILKKLARAGRDRPEAVRLAGAIGCPDLGCREFLDMLERVIDRMHLLELGTLDSFFYRIIRNFPFELGLSGPPEILDENAVRTEKQRVYDHVFHHPASRHDTRKAFLEAFKQATWGTEEKRLGARLDRFIEENHEVFLQAPEPGAWGNPDRIWPEGNDWLGFKGKPDEDIETLATLFANRELTDRQRETVEKFLSALREWSPGAPWLTGMKRPVTNALKVFEQLESGEADYVIGGKKLRIAGEECRRLANVIRRLFAAELETKLQVTRGLYEILNVYETAYGELVRAGGRLTFGDILILLSGTPGGTAPCLGQGNPSGDRLAIDYRLDGRFDHWLLDEFQDTSNAQWAVLRNLIDEVVQDAEGCRSFFYVGDVKQAIFAWRQGDVRLFREIFNHYNQAAPSGIVERRMSESWRSGPAVIATVNRVFDDHAAMSGMFPEAAVARWRDGWDSHEARHRDASGYAAYFEAADAEEQHALILETLREVQPLRRGLSCAVLVQSNRKANEVVHYLREHGDMPVASETDIHPGVDNPLGIALLSLFKWAAYPGDSYAREHVLMTPFGELIKARFPSGVAAIKSILDGIHREGFSATAAEWFRRLEEHGGIERFSRGRSEIIIAAARRFDRQGGRNVADFIDYISAYSVRQSGTAETVQVMTIHKAKGLGFDMVILPHLEGNRLARRRDGMGVCQTEHREVEWVFDLPTKEIVENDDVLAAYDQVAAADACYERLCQLYVAMTRTKRAMYLIAPPMKENSRSANFIRLLNETLISGEATSRRIGEAETKVVYEEGDAAWHAGIEAIDEVPRSGVVETGVIDFPRCVRHRRKTPSKAKARKINAISLFSLDSRKSLDFGTRVHEIFAGIEWFDEDTESRIQSAMSEEDAAPMTVEACGEVLECLRVDAVRRVLGRPDPGAEVWRERGFEVILRDEWLTGTFDRVTIEKDGTGRVCRGTILDYKTDKLGESCDLASAASEYSEQLKTYRSALARMTALPESEIACKLLFTQLRRVVDVD